MHKFLLVLVMISVAGLAPFNLASDESWETHYTKAVEAYLQGNHEDAVTLWLAALKMVDDAKPNDPRPIIILNNLSDTYYAMGNHTEAESFLKRAIKLKRNITPPNHLHIAKNFEKIERGKWAIECERYASLHMARSLEKLGLLYRKQHRYSESELLFQESLSLLEQFVEFESEHTGRVLLNLAGMYVDHGRHTEAETLFKRALEIGEKTPKKFLLFALHGLALTYWSQGNFSEAERLLERALEITTKEPYYQEFNVKILANLALIHQDQLQFSEAEKLLKRALLAVEESRGSQHPDLTVYLEMLEELYYEQGKYIKAEKSIKRSLAIVELELGSDHPEVAVRLDNLADIYSKQGKHAEAEALIRKAVAIAENALGSNDPAVARGLCALAARRSAQGDSAEAESLIKRALAIFQSSYREGSMELLYDLESCAIYLQRPEFTDKAGRAADSARVIYELLDNLQHKKGLRKEFRLARTFPEVTHTWQARTWPVSFPTYVLTIDTIVTSSLVFRSRTLNSDAKSDDESKLVSHQYTSLKIHHLTIADDCLYVAVSLKPHEKEEISLVASNSAFLTLNDGKQLPASMLVLGLQPQRVVNQLHSPFNTSAFTADTVVFLPDGASRVDKLVPMPRDIASLFQGSRLNQDELYLEFSFDYPELGERKVKSLRVLGSTALPIDSSQIKRFRVPRNIIAVENKSDEPVLVRLIGPTKSVFWVEGRNSETIHGQTGRYHLKLRYGGKEGSYTYYRGEMFFVKEDLWTYSNTTIILQTADGGNYETWPINQEEFERDE